VSMPDETWQVSADERDRHLKRAIQDHYREHGSYVPAFGAVVGYTAVVMAGSGSISACHLTSAAIQRVRCDLSSGLGKPSWAPSGATRG
jgi:hypothetical protein